MATLLELNTPSLPYAIPQAHTAQQLQEHLAFILLLKEFRFLYDRFDIKLSFSTSKLIDSESWLGGMPVTPGNSSIDTVNYLD